MIDEKELRTTLEAEARAIRVPAELAARTLEAAAAETRLRILDRIRAWRDARHVARRHGYPRWMYASAAAALAVGLFAVGTVVNRPPARLRPLEAHKSLVRNAPAGGVVNGPPERVQTSRDAVGGQVTGVTSGGRTSVDATNTSRDSDVSSGAAGGTKSFSETQPAPAPVPPNTGTGTFPPKVVKNADIQVQVKRGAFDRAWNRALNVASRYGGFVTNSSTQQTDNRISSGSFTLRVPAPKLDAALKDLRELGTLKALTTSGNDISAQIVDLDARIRALQAEQAQLVELLGKAEKISDILPIRTQLQNVQQELESLRGQKKGFQNQVDYATVNATIFEPNAAPQPLDDGIIVRAWRTAVSAGLTIVAGTLVVLGGLIPLALIALAVWLVVAAARRRRT